MDDVRHKAAVAHGANKKQLPKATGELGKARTLSLCRRLWPKREAEGGQTFVYEPTEKNIKTVFYYTFNPVRAS